jgi:3-hydroxy-9,10-secoandrosta-1,3,5(10)-triene-9,17-dione monooxygenase reductase component
VDREGIDPHAFRDVCGRFATGVCVITSMTDAGPSGLTANAVTSLSLRPPLMVVCFDNQARTLEAVRRSGRFGVQFLAHDQEQIAARFASKEPEHLKFDGVDWSERSGVPVIARCLGGVACSLNDLVPGGDHMIAVGEVHDLWSSDGEALEPLVFYRGDYWALSSRAPAPPEVDAALEGG